MLIGFDARLYGVHHRGIGRYSSCLLDQISKVDEVNKYILFTNNNQGIDNLNHWPKVQSPYRAYSLSEQFNFYLTLKKYNLDLMHFPHWNIPIIYKRPYIVTIHDLILHYFSNERITTLPSWWYKLKIKIYFRVINQVIKHASRIIAVSQSTANDIVKFYPQAVKKINVIYEAPTIDGRNYNSRVLPKLVSQDYLLNVGAAYPHKNLEHLVLSFSKLLPYYPNLQLILVGRRDFFYQRLQQFVLKQHLDKNIIFWSEASELDLASLYQHTVCYITPSLAEGFNLGAVEAMSFNVPVLASNINVHREILQSAANYFEPSNTDDLTKKLQEIIGQVNLKKNIVSKAQTIIANYSWRKAAQDTIACYQSIK